MFSVEIFLKIYGKWEKSPSLTLSGCIQKILKRNDAHISESHGRDLSIDVVYLWFSFELISKRSLQRWPMWANLMCFLQLKKEEKRTLNSVLLKNSFDTCRRFVHKTRAHARVRWFPDESLLRIFERKRSKGLEISGLLKRVRVAREGYTRAYIYA